MAKHSRWLAFARLEERENVAPFPSAHGSSLSLSKVIGSVLNVHIAVEGGFIAEVEAEDVEEVMHTVTSTANEAISQAGYGWLAVICTDIVPFDESVIDLFKDPPPSHF